MSDHRVDIFEAERVQTAEIRRELADPEGDGWAGSFLEVRALTGSSDRYRVEFLLTCGGPTVEVVADSARGVRFCHSWGRDSVGGDVHSIVLGGEAAEFWQGLAEEAAELV